MLDDSEPMAILHWDFKHPSGHQCVGQISYDHRSTAESLCKTMNEMTGEGTHWVKVLNQTKKELLNDND